jgi:hypothetical protein
MVREITFDVLPETHRAAVLDAYRGLWGSQANLPGVTRRALRGIEGYVWFVEPARRMLWISTLTTRSSTCRG